MGNFCICLKFLQGPIDSKKVNYEQAPVSTDRRLQTKKQVPQTYFQQSDKKNAINQSQLSQSGRSQNKHFSRKQSMVNGSNLYNRSSSIFQSYIDTSSILIINPRSKIQVDNIDSSQYYTLIDKVAFVKKTADRLRVTTPGGSSQLHCQPQFMISTLFIAQGIPLQTIPQFNNQKTFVQTDDSPLKLIIKLNCLQPKCQKKIKLTYCKAYVNIQKIKCPKCEKVGKWGLLDIQANAPIWGQGRRISDHQRFQPAPAEFRLLGCVMCFRFGDLRKIQGCDCHICKNCDISGTEIICPICNPFQ